MSEPIRCPDCGHLNPPDSTACENCRFPLTEDPSPPAPPVREPRRAGLPRDPGNPFAMIRPIRPRRPRPQANVALSLWLGVGSFLALLLVLIAIQANVQRGHEQVDGSSDMQQKSADSFREALAKDSTDTQARVGLADVLFDTGNWSEAIVHYRSAVRHDSTLVSAIVDQGVCYYNLGDTDEAERLFHLALGREPHQPYALFNLGIVFERRGNNDKALGYYHQALESSPPDNMKQALMDAMQRTSKATGKQAQPLNNPR